MENMQIYSLLANTPKEAKKEISAGRLRGFTDINPAWRIKRLTEVFGPCGIGWKYTITRQDIVYAGDEAKAFVHIDLFYRDTDMEWSEAVPGFGGSSFISKEKNGLYIDDECFKKALSDAIGTAAKALGMSHDIYFANDRTKYTAQSVPQVNNSSAKRESVPVCENCGNELTPVTGKNGKEIDVNSLSRMTVKKYGRCLCAGCASAQTKTNLEV